MQKGKTMKNIFTLLSEIGVELPEDKKTDFETAFNENYKTVSEVDKIRTARDNYKSQLDTAQNTLKEFEGVDVKDLQNKIATLNADLAKKDDDYKQQIADMEFNNILNSAISASGAKNAKAVKPFLDIEILKESKNQAEDIKSALETVKTENDYLFNSDEPIKSPVKSTGTQTIGGNPMEAMRVAMGLPTENK